MNRRLVRQHGARKADNTSGCDRHALLQFCTRKDPAQEDFLPSKLKFKDLSTGAVVFRTGGESDYVTKLLDGEKKTPIAVLKRLAHNTQAVHAAASSDNVAGEKLFDVRFKLGESNTIWFEDGPFRGLCRCTNERALPDRARRRLTPAQRHLLARARL